MVKVKREGEPLKIPKWSVHVCRWDKECRSFGAANRVDVSTPWVRVGVALDRGSRFAGRLINFRREGPRGRAVWDGEEPPRWTMISRDRFH